LGIGEAGFQSLIIGVDFEAPLVGSDGFEVVMQAKIGSAEAAVALRLVGLELDGLLGVRERIGVVVEGGIGGGLARVNDVVGGD